MLQRRRAHRPLTLLSGLLLMLLLLPASAAATDDAESGAREPAAPSGQCAVTGHVADSADGVSGRRGELQEQDVWLAGGEPLDRREFWVIPDGGNPVVVLDSTVPLPAGTVAVAAGGQRYEVDSFEPAPGEAGYRYVTHVVLPHLGPTTRALGLHVGAGHCLAELTLMVDRSLFSTVVGQASVALAALFGLLTVLVARLQRGGWLRRFLWAAPLGALTGAAQVGVLHEAGMADPFGSLPWWGLVLGIGAAALLPLTRWPRPSARSTPGAAARSDGVAGRGDTPAAAAEVGDPTPAAPHRAGALVSSAVALAAVLGVAVAAMLLDGRPAAAQPVVITPEQARVTFERTLVDGLVQRYTGIPVEVRGAVHALATGHGVTTDGELGEVSVGVPADQSGYPAWFVGSAQVPTQEEALSVFARFDRAAADEPWQMTGFVWSDEADLPGPALDNQGWIAAAPDVGDLAMTSDDLAEHYVEWHARQWGLDAGQAASDDLLRLRARGDSYLRRVAEVDTSDLAGIAAPASLVYPGIEGEVYAGLAWPRLPEPELRDLIPLADGSTLVSYRLELDWVLLNTQDATVGSCAENLGFRLAGTTYRSIVTSYEIHLMAWVPLGSAGTDEPVVVADPVVHLDRPAEGSEPC